MNNTEEKFLYCDTCKNYPDKVTEDRTITENRVWNGECYELVSTDTGCSDSIYFCCECDSKLREVY